MGSFKSFSLSLLLSGLVFLVGLKSFLISLLIDLFELLTVNLSLELNVACVFVVVQMVGLISLKSQLSNKILSS